MSTKISTQMFYLSKKVENRKIGLKELFHIKKFCFKVSEFGYCDGVNTYIMTKPFVFKNGVRYRLSTLAYFFGGSKIF